MRSVRERELIVRVFEFDHAIVREPGRSVVQGLRSDITQTPRFDGVRREHAAYVDALRGAGLQVDTLPALEDYPDAIFVEDPAFVLPEAAILLRPGAATRVGEREAMRPAVQGKFPAWFELPEHALADGGDILVLPDAIIIGLSSRTNQAGAGAFATIVQALGRKCRIVETPAGILHFKTAVALLDQERVVATRRMAASGVFAGIDILTVPDGEEAAANLLRVNDFVLVGDRFPRTIDAITQKGYRVVALPVTEIGKLDAGLSCMSLRWHAQHRAS